MTTSNTPKAVVTVSQALTLTCAWLESGDENARLTRIVGVVREALKERLEQEAGLLNPGREGTK